MIYDCVIVGAGIGGLHLSNTLSQKYKNKKICLCEMGQTYGGRVATFNQKNIVYEMGAARFNKNHKILYSLIKKYKLDKKMYKLPSGWNNINTSKEISNSKFKNVNVLINSLIKKCQSKSRSYLQSKNLLEICEDLFNKESAQFLKDNHPYNTELTLLNGEIAVDLFKNDLNEDFDFYILFGGLSQLTKNLYQEYKKNGGQFKPYHKLLKYSYEDKIFTCLFQNKDRTIEIKTNNLVLAVNGESMYDIKSNLNIPDVKAIKNSPLLRTYSIYPKNSDGKYWFHDIGKVVTNNYLKFVIPYDMQNGVIMISYTDGPNAKYWKKKIENQTQQDTLDKLLKKTFPDKVIPKPLDTRNYYWDDGMTYWKKNIDAKKISKNMIQPIKNISLYICGDSYSLQQAWMEGALSTSNSVFQIIKL